MIIKVSSNRVSGFQSLEKYTHRLIGSNLDHLNLIIIKPLTFVIIECNHLTKFLLDYTFR